MKNIKDTLNLQNHCQLIVEKDKERIMEAIINIQSMNIESVFFYDSKKVNKSLSKLDGLVDRKNLGKEKIKVVLDFVKLSKNKKIMVMDMKQEKGILKMYKTFLPEELVLGIIGNIK
jgi:hypothetical protein